MSIMLSILQYLSMLGGCLLFPFAVFTDIVIDILVFLSSSSFVAVLHRRRCLIAIASALAALTWCVSITLCPLNAGFCVCEHMRVPEGGGSDISLSKLSTAQLVVLIPRAMHMALNASLEICRRFPIVVVICLGLAAVL